MLFSHGGIFHLVGFFKRKYLVDRFVKNGRHLQCQNGRRHVFARLNGIDGLPGHADTFSKLLLRHSQHGPLNANIILHRLPPFSFGAVPIGIWRDR